jgi:hypothetical protein
MGWDEVRNTGGEPYFAHIPAFTAKYCLPAGGMHGFVPLPSCINTVSVQNARECAMVSHMRRMKKKHR